MEPHFRRINRNVNYIWQLKGIDKYVGLVTLDKIIKKLVILGHLEKVDNVSNRHHLGTRQHAKD